MAWFASISTKWQTWQALPPLVRREFWRAFFIMPLLWLLLNWRGLQSTRTFCQKYLLQPIEDPGIDRFSTRREVILAVTIAEKYCYPKPNCLRRSLCLWLLLCTHGISTNLRIGARTKDGIFQAHAWVEDGTTVLNDRPDVASSYAVFDRV
jgi:hypothetical protein